MSKFNGAYINYRRRAKYYPMFFGEAYTGDELQKLLGHKVKFVGFGYRKGFGYFVVDKESWQECSKTTFEILLKDKEIISDYFQGLQKEFDLKTIEFVKILGDLDNKTNTELITLLEKIGNLFSQIQLHEDCIAYFSESLISDELEKKLVEKFQDRKKAMEMMSLLTNLDEMSFINRELYELAMIAKDKSLNRLENHYEEWTAFRFDYWGPAVSFDEFQNRYLELVDNPNRIDEIIEKFDNYTLKTKSKKDKLVEEFNLDRDTVSLASLGAQVGLLTDRKKYKVTKLAFIIDQILKLIGSRLNIPQEWFNWILPEEIEKVINGSLKLSESQINLRRENSVIFYQNGKCTDILTEGEDFNFIQKLIDEDLAKIAKEVKGLIAYGGIYQGRVVIINSPEDKKKAVEGMVMVSPKTTVDFVHLMKMAGAVVSDFGGLTSHTAIVAREFKIPAVVGTGEATQVFKDGDLVEVNADKGVVRKLESKE